MSATQTETPEVVERTLTTADRCDRCNSQAYVCVTMPSTLDLFFCLHHFRKHETKLRSQALFILDESEKLNNK